MKNVMGGILLVMSSAAYAGPGSEALAIVDYLRFKVVRVPDGITVQRCWHLCDKEIKLSFTDLQRLQPEMEASCDEYWLDYKSYRREKCRAYVIGQLNRLASSEEGIALTFQTFTDSFGTAIEHIYTLGKYEKTLSTSSMVR